MRLQPLRHLVILLLASIAAFPTRAQQPELQIKPQPALQSALQSAFQPEIGQSGKDVVWVPTPDALVNRMLRLARVVPSDTVVDLGAGDGKIAIAAARDFRARARGVEFNPNMVELARRNARAANLGDAVEIIQGDIFQTDFSDATVVTLYLLPSLNLKLRPKLLELRAGTRIVSHAFDMGEWEADETTRSDGSQAYLWIVPAHISGLWKIEHAGSYGKESWEVTLKQRYQRIEGTVNRQGRLSPLTGTVNGLGVRFSINDADQGERVFVGRVTNQGMTGRTRTQGGTEIPFEARRD